MDPLKDDDMAPTTTTSIRLTPDEAAAVRAAAGARGVGHCTFIRSSALRAAGRPVPAGRRQRTDLAIAVATLLGELGHIGRNLNQLARHANSGGRVDGAALAELRIEAERLTGVLLDMNKT